MRADLPNGWNDLHVLRMLLYSHFLNSSFPFAPLSLSLTVNKTYVLFLLLLSPSQYLHPSLYTLSISHRARLLPELVEGPNSGSTEWRRPNRM